MPLKDVQIPETKSPPEFSYVERRAAIYAEILDCGHPDLLNRTALAQKYDVHHSTISRDIDAIADEVRDELGSDAVLILNTVFQTALRETVESGDWMSAVRIAEKWSDWLFDRGVQEKAPKKVEHGGAVNGDPSRAYMEMLASAFENDDMGDPNALLEDPRETLDAYEQREQNGA